MSEDDIDGIGGDSSNAARMDRDRRAPRFSWTPAYEATFFRSLCESVSRGLRENNSFKAEAWERAAQALQATHGAFPAKSHLINKSDNARKRFRLWRGLREDPEFLYNSVAKTVTATEDAWRAHIEREPLSRALRGRPFEHEEYMEILYPDVVGSGGAPKRIMRPRRQTDGGVIEDGTMPGTGVLNLHNTNPVLVDGNTARAILSQTPSSSNSSLPQQTIPPTTLTAGASALTPPEDTLATTQARKRRQPGVTTIGTMPASQSIDSVMSPTVGAAATNHLTNASPKRRRTSQNPASTLTTPFAARPAAQHGAAATATTAETSAAAVTSLLQFPLVEEVLDALKTRAAPPPRWRELALDIFFKEFSGEELDLQVKISENVLSNNENKAMVFCKMPPHVRQHWVGKFREMHQLNKTS